MIDEEDVPLVEIGHRISGDEHYVQARAPGAKQHIEYGPMPEGAVQPFIVALKRSVVNLGIDGMAQQEANLKTAIAAATGARIEEFNPEKEKAWLQEKKL